LQPKPQQVKEFNNLRLDLGIELDRSTARAETVNLLNCEMGKPSQKNELREQAEKIFYKGENHRKQKQWEQAWACYEFMHDAIKQTKRKRRSFDVSELAVFGGDNCRKKASPPDHHDSTAICLECGNEFSYSGPRVRRLLRRDLCGFRRWSHDFLRVTFAGLARLPRQPHAVVSRNPIKQFSLSSTENLPKVC